MKTLKHVSTPDSDREHSTITPANADKSEGGKRSLERELNGWGNFRLTDGDGKIRFSIFEVQYVGLVDIWLIFG